MKSKLPSFAKHRFIIKINGHDLLNAEVKTLRNLCLQSGKPNETVFEISSDIKIGSLKVYPK